MAKLKAAQSLTDAIHQAASSQQAVGASQIADTAAAQKLLLARLDPKEQGQPGKARTQRPQRPARKQSKTWQLRPRHQADPGVERFAAPLIVADAPSTIAMTSPASTAVFAGEQLHMVTQADSHLTAGHTLASVSGKTNTWFTHSGGLEAVAANGPLSIQAHTDARSCWPTRM